MNSLKDASLIMNASSVIGVSSEMDACLGVGAILESVVIFMMDVILIHVADLEINLFLESIASVNSESLTK